MCACCVVFVVIALMAGEQRCSKRSTHGVISCVSDGCRELRCLAACASCVLSVGTKDIGSEDMHKLHYMLAELAGEDPFVQALRTPTGLVEVGLCLCFVCWGGGALAVYCNIYNGSQKENLVIFGHTAVKLLTNFN